MNIEEIDFYDFAGISSVFLDTPEKKLEYIEYLKTIGTDLTK